MFFRYATTSKGTRQYWKGIKIVMSDIKKSGKKEQDRSKVKNNRSPQPDINRKGIKRENYNEHNQKRKLNNQSDKANSGKVSRDKKAVMKKQQVDKSNENKCIYAKKCGGCTYQGTPYSQQLEKKLTEVRRLIGRYCEVTGIVGMDNPYNYRNKVHAAFDMTRRGEIISGVYQEGTHEVVPVEYCQIEDAKSDEIINDIRGMLRSFKIKTYDEDTGYGLLRHVLVRRGFKTNEIMVVLILGSPILPSKNNFVKALRQKHPEISTVIINVNDKKTSMVLGDKESVIYGKGFINDILCGCTFKISPKSFYQVNPVQTEKLYGRAIELAGLTGKERVLDAYCGIGTIGIIASKKAADVIGVELNRAAVKDAIVNAKINDIKNVRFYCEDAGEYMEKYSTGLMHADGQNNANGHIDVVFMDPPRAGSDEKFMSSVVKLSPKKVVYISCNPETLARDLRYFKKHGYKAEVGEAYDMFPFTNHVETVCLLSRQDVDS